MDIYSQIQKLEELKSYIATELPVFAEQVLANDLTTLVAKRVIETGVNHLGAPFKGYSTNPIPAYKFWGKSRTQAAEKKVRALARQAAKDKAKAKASSALSYKEFREINNLKTDKKNFEFTGTMWQEFNIVSTSRTETSFRVSMGGTTTDAANKIESHSEREGVSIIEANEAERALAQKATSVWLDEAAERILNG